MKKHVKLLSLLLALCLAVCCFAGCQDGKDDPQGSEPVQAEFVDYVAQTTLDRSSGTLQEEVTVRSYIDGDTTHFNVPTSVSDNGILKARYLCVNTPESTGKIEPWGKKASTFTKEKLSAATSIIIESNDSKWNLDSTGGRHLVWVWYKTADAQDYRCLNLELIQNGLSISCGNVGERYGEVASKAFQQAKAQKLHVFDTNDDPDFFYGDAYEVDLKGLRSNIALYENCKVAFEGVVTRNNNNSVYVESYDAETDMYYGVSVYYGFETGELLNNLKVGNLARIVGTVTYYETGGTWQISGLQYREFKPEDPSNTIKISDGHTAANKLTDAATFTSGQVELEVMSELNSEETTIKTFPYADLAMSTSIRMENLTVNRIYTTSNGGDSDGAMTLTCTSPEGITVDVRTIVLYKEDGTMLNQSDLLYKTIDVNGIVDYFSGDYQIKVFTTADITVHE
jgi:micrococcal nuclease